MRGSYDLRVCASVSKRLRRLRWMTDDVVDYSSLWYEEGLVRLRLRIFSKCHTLTSGNADGQGWLVVSTQFIW